MAQSQNIVAGDNMAEQDAITKVSRRMTLAVGHEVEVTIVLLYAWLLGYPGRSVVCAHRFGL